MVEATARLLLGPASAQLAFCVIGDLIVDRTYTVRRQARRHSLATGEFFLKDQPIVGLGGAPSTAEMLSRIGRTTVLFPKCTRGELLAHASDLLVSQELSEANLNPIDVGPWTLPEVTRFLESDHQNRPHEIFRIEERPATTPIFADISRIARVVPRGAYTVVSDYGRGFVTAELCGLIASLKPALVVLDPAEDWPAYRAISDLHTIVIRWDQLTQYADTTGNGLAPRSIPDLQRLAPIVFDEFPSLRALVVKDHGADDVMMVTTTLSDCQAHIRLISLARSDADRTRLGGGTTFCAYYLAALAVGTEIGDAAAVAQLASVAMSAVDRAGVPTAVDLVPHIIAMASGLNIEEDICSPIGLAGLAPRKDYF